MLAAVLVDLACVVGVSAVTLTAENESAFRRFAAASDWTLVIAPETDGVLSERCRWVGEAGGRLLGPTLEAIRLTGDKRALAEHLATRGVPTLPTLPLDSAAITFPAVCKPRDGAGSQATSLVRDRADLRRATAAEPGVEFIMQPYFPGLPASVAFLLGPRQRLALPAAAQLLSDDGRFHYRGGRLPLSPDLAERATRVARQAVDAVPGLLGYVGVDVVLGDGADAVIEINPRLTTSYVGLRALARTNLAAALLAVAGGETVAPLAWRDGAVAWTADGAVAARGPGVW
jgi:predicted ATP-grasp superfamily ATP-dependent carboligase